MLFGEFEYGKTWWRHQMETFSALLAICAGNSPVSGEFPAQRPATRSFDVFFDQRPNKRLSKQTWGWWFETHSPPLWRHSNEIIETQTCIHYPMNWVVIGSGNGLAPKRQGRSVFFWTNDARDLMRDKRFARLQSVNTGINTGVINRWIRESDLF